jgi:hypothetical protein
MAKALKCPSCGATHRLDGLNGATKFRCDDCGQSLKVPVVASSTVAADASADPPADEPIDDAADASLVNDDDGADEEAPDAPPSDVDGTSVDADVPIALATASVPPPPPRRHAPGAPRGREIIGVSATVSASGGARVVAAPAPAPQRDATTTRRKVRWYWRMVAWIAAVPIGFVITVWPSYEFGLIRKDDVLDVFVGSGAGRYTRLAIVTVLWALVTAVLVQLFVEGGRWWAARRRARPEPAPGRGASATAS